MKKLLLPILFFIAACSNKQPDKKNENTDLIVDMNGVGTIKLEMKQAELEKLLNKKIPLTNPTDTTSGSWQDSAKINYKGADLLLLFQRNYSSPDIFVMELIRIKTSSPLCKTQAGIAVGSDKLAAITTYQDSALQLQPDVYDSTNSKSIITIHDYHDTRFIGFQIENKKVTALEMGIRFHDSE